jgi:hypothetical protein
MRIFFLPLQVTIAGTLCIITNLSFVSLSDGRIFLVANGGRGKLKKFWKKETGLIEVVPKVLGNRNTVVFISQDHLFDGIQLYSLIFFTKITSKYG